MISVQNVVKHFGGVAAVDGVEEQKAQEKVDKVLDGKAA